MFGFSTTSVIKDSMLGPLPTCPTAWLDPSQAIFTDTTHLAPVTADGQNVKAIISSDGIAYTSPWIRTKETYCGKTVIRSSYSTGSQDGLEAAEDPYLILPQNQADILLFVAYPNGRANIPSGIAYAQDTEGEFVFSLQTSLSGTTTGFKFLFAPSDAVPAFTSSEIVSNGWLLVRMTWNAGSAPLLRVYDAVSRELLSSTAGSGTAGFTGDPSAGAFLPISCQTFRASVTSLVYYGKHYRNLGGVYTDREIAAILHDFAVGYTPLTVTPWLDPAEGLYQDEAGTIPATVAGDAVNRWVASDGLVFSGAPAGRTLIADGVRATKHSEYPIDRHLACPNDTVVSGHYNKAEYIFKLRLPGSVPLTGAANATLFLSEAKDGHGNEVRAFYSVDSVLPRFYFYLFATSQDSGGSNNGQTEYSPSLPLEVSSDWFFIRFKWNTGSNFTFSAYDSSGNLVFSSPGNSPFTNGYSEGEDGPFMDFNWRICQGWNIGPSVGIDYGGAWRNLGNNYTNAELDAIFQT